MLHTRSALWLLGLLLSLGLSSCFELVEEVDMNEDGSGKVSFTINASQSKANLANYMKLGTVEGYELPTRKDIEAEMDKLVQLVRGVKGMSEVRMSRDFDNFVFVVSGNFDKVATLNAVVNAVAKAMNQSDVATPVADNFAYNGRGFKRLFAYDMRQVDYKSVDASLRYVFEQSKYTAIYRFPKPVKKSSNRHAKVSRSGRAVMLSHSIAELAQGKGSIANDISF